MAVTVPDEFQARASLMSKSVAAEEVIEDGDMLLLVQNNHHLYGHASLGVMLDESWLFAQLPLSAAFTELFNFSHRFSELRETRRVRVVLRGTDAQIRVTIYNAAETVILSGPTTITADSSTTIDPPGAQDVVVVVEEQYTVITGSIKAIHMEEQNLNAGALPPA